MLKGTDILITGGYGTIGRRVAADLAPDYAGRVVEAGRSAEKAVQLGAELEHGVRGRRVDVSDLHLAEAALEGVGLVMSCVGRRGPAPRPRRRLRRLYSHLCARA
jgi:saccharopine dehydrogenase-like NADP-dependent oxidoreductase